LEEDMNENLAGWLEFLRELESDGIEYDLSIALGEEFGVVYIEPEIPEEPETPEEPEEPETPDYPEEPGGSGELATIVNYQYEVELPSGEEERVRDCIVYAFAGWKQQPNVNPDKPWGVPFLVKARKGNSIWKLPEGKKVLVNSGQNWNVDSDMGLYKNYAREWLDHGQEPNERYFLDRGNLTLG